MCISIVLPGFDSDKIDKGLIPKTSGVIAENLTLPRQQVSTDICPLHTHVLVLQPFLTSSTSWEPSGLQWSYLHEHCCCSGWRCWMGALWCNQTETGSHPEQPGSHRGPDCFTTACNTYAYAFITTPTITWQTGIHYKEQQQKVGKILAKNIWVNPWVLQNSLRYYCPFRTQGFNSWGSILKS